MDMSHTLLHNSASFEPQKCILSVCTEAPVDEFAPICVMNYNIFGNWFRRFNSAVVKTHHSRLT